jgi:hypothetical protein
VVQRCPRGCAPPDVRRGLRIVPCQGRSSSDPSTYLFDVMAIESAADLLPEPAPGQQFWLSHQQSYFEALREGQQGPVVLASATGLSQAGAVSKLAAALGVSVTLEKACPYTTSIDLWDVVFGTDPPVRVPSYTTGTFTIAGRRYRASMWGETYFRLLVYPAS